MSTKISTGTKLSSDFYLNNFYQANRSARKASGRKELTKNELSYEDARAFKRAVSKLSNFKYTDSENVDNIKGTIKAFTDTYNNTIGSSSHYGKQLKSLMKGHESELKDLGITFEEDGSLSVSDSLLEKADLKKIKKVFSAEESDLLKKASSIAKRLHSNSYNNLYEEMTGNGGKINIIL